MNPVVEVLTFVFSTPWKFFGCWFLLATICNMRIVKIKARKDSRNKY